MPLLILTIIALIILIPLIIIYNKYKTFVIDHSVLLRNLRTINEKYHFNEIQSFNLEKSYDNENFYNTVSPIDYLTYQLQFIKNDVKLNITKTIENSNMHDLYLADIKEIKKFNEYDTEIPFKYTKLLPGIEEKLFYKSLLKPTIYFKINVKIILTDINGKYKTNKKAEFEVDVIEDVISRLNDKSNNRFNDEQIWKSISIVERAKVSNKMRFAVYKRDNNRCRKCGSRYNLEVDHIIPIAKGGKTVFDNLQTLCKSCIQRKSDTVEGYTNKTYDENIKYCPKCKAPLRIVNGKNGKFYGCVNYPKCEYTERA